MLTVRERALKRSLDALGTTYGKKTLDSDPVLFLHRYDDPRDIEVAGFVSASLAYGRVSLIKRSLETVLGFMGPSPAGFVTAFDPSSSRDFLDGFVHRFTKGRDLSALFTILGWMIREKGSIEAFLLENGTGNGRERRGNDAGADGDVTNTSAREEILPDRTKRSGGDVSEILGRFSRRALSMPVPSYNTHGTIPPGAGVRFFFPSPAGGSACKRLNLFLRWMVRGPDGVDLGLWRNLSPSSLVVPVDTHMSRIARFIGLTQRTDASWKTALEITGALRKLDPDDPVRYDYAITRLGILGVCGGGEAEFRCVACSLGAHCIHGSESHGFRSTGRTG